MQIRKKISALSIAGIFTATLFAQTTDTLQKQIDDLSGQLKKIKNLRISGYIQPQWQHVDSAGAPSFAGGNFDKHVDSRFKMRRGRVKFTYTNKNTQFVLQPDITENGIYMRETYLRFTDPWSKYFTLTAGCLQVQYGFEIIQSSQVRETPERARMNQVLFPTERDLGIFLSISPPEGKKLSFLKLDLGYSNGSANVSPEFDSHKDISARLSLDRKTNNKFFEYALGVSFYKGGFREGYKDEYHMGTITTGDAGFVVVSDTANFEKIAPREYMGADAQFSLNWGIGKTTIRAEYSKGTQSGTSNSSKSLSAAPSSPIYIREFDGAYFYFIQDIFKSKFQFVAKYDWYDPNINVSGKEIGKTGTNTRAADIKFNTLGFGMVYYYDENIKLVVYYDNVVNEETSVSGYTKDIKDNVVTCRLQYRF